MGVINKTTDEINDLLDKVKNMPEEGVLGKTPVLETGTTTTLDPGQSATSDVVSVGTDSSGNPRYKINFGIPRGADGSGGSGGGTADSVEWKNVLNKPTWVNSSTKPTYTATEVGALPVSTTIPSKTSQLTNDSNYVTSSTLKTINGQSIVGSGNIEISGSGSGIADAPSDGQIYGRKNGNWSAITGGTGGSVDISDILQRIVQLSEINGTCTDEDYNTLKGYADNGTVVYVSYSGTSSNIMIIYTDETLYVYLYFFDNNKNHIQVFVIESSKKVSYSLIDNLETNTAGYGLLGTYNKPSSYSAITKNDSISTAIGKLEAGIGSSSSTSSGIYYLSEAILNLTNESTNDEVLNAFGGIEKLNEFVTEVGINGKQAIIYSKLSQITVGSGKSIPVSCDFIAIGNTSFYLNFLCRDNNVNVKKTIRITYSSSGAKINVFEVIKTYLDGYGLDSSFYSLTSSSSNEEISSSLGGESGMKGLIQAITDGNRIYIKSSNELPQKTDLLCNMYSKSENGDMQIFFFGFGYGLWGGFGGYIQIQYTKSSNTFTVSVGSLP